MKTTEEQARDYADTLIDGFGIHGIPTNTKDIKRMVTDAYIAGAKSAANSYINRISKNDMKETKIKGWIAKNGNGDLFLHLRNPDLCIERDGYKYWGKGYPTLNVSGIINLDISVDDKPKEAEITIKIKE